MEFKKLFGAYIAGWRVASRVPRSHIGREISEYWVGVIEAGVLDLEDNRVKQMLEGLRINRPEAAGAIDGCRSRQAAFLRGHRMQQRRDIVSVANHAGLSVEFALQLEQGVLKVKSRQAMVRLIYGMGLTWTEFVDSMHQLRTGRTAWRINEFIPVSNSSCGVRRIGVA